MRDAARTHNKTQSSRCVWPRAYSRRNPHRAYTLHPDPHPTAPTRRTVPRRLHMPHRSAPPTAAALAPQVHAQVVHASAAPALHQRRPPTVGMMCQPQQVERTPAHARAKTRTILYAHGTRLNCADEAHARRALCMHEPWYRFLPWYALPRKPPCRPPPPSCLTPTLACALMRPSRRAPLKYCVGGGGRGRWQSR